MVTLWALLCGVIPALLFVAYDPTLSNEYPLFLHLLAAAGLFMYQTFDALDGKQARRIQAFSPLGQLFDHGCDSFSAASFIIFLLVCLKIPSAHMNLMIYLSAITMVYMSNLAEKYTHVLTTSYGQLGVTEVQFLQIAALLSTGFGWTNWMYAPLIGGYGLNYIAGFGIIGLGVFACLVFYRQIMATNITQSDLLGAAAPLGYIFAACNSLLFSNHIHDRQQFRSLYWLHHPRGRFVRLDLGLQSHHQHRR